MKHKLTAIISVFLLLFTLTACHKKTASEEFYENYQKVKVSDALFKSKTRGTTKKEAEKIFGKPASKDDSNKNMSAWTWKKDSVKLQIAFSENEACLTELRGLKWDENKDIAKEYSKIDKGASLSKVIDKCGKPNQINELYAMNNHIKDYRYKYKSHEYNFIFNEKNKLINKTVK